MTCDHCGDTLVRCVVEWEDGSASVMWRCACELEDADHWALEHSPRTSPTGACMVDADTDADVLGTRGMA